MWLFITQLTLEYYLSPKTQVLTNFLAPQVLNLKVGAQVMCIKNFDDQLVNGTLGKVIDFVDRDTYMKSESKENPSTETSDEVSGLNDYIFNDFQNPRKLSKRMHLLQNKFYSRVSFHKKLKTNWKAVNVNQN